LLLAGLLAQADGHGAERTLTLDPAQTKIRFVLEATLHNVEGAARLVEGRIMFDPERGTAVGVVRVDARSASTGIGMRDSKMHADVLESERFPEIVFFPERLVAMEGDASRRRLSVEGRIRIRTAERAFAIPVEAEIHDRRVRIRGSFVIPYVRWGMTDVSTFLLRVGATVEVHIDAAGMLDLPLLGAP
jgi:polyisoprenoid-binding protein YceI